MTSCTSRPPIAAVGWDISPWIRQARTQVGWRLAVASSANISRPRLAPAPGDGVAATLRRKACTYAEGAVSAGRAGVLSRSPALRPPPPEIGGSHGPVKPVPAGEVEENDPAPGGERPPPAGGGCVL